MKPYVCIGMPYFIGERIEARTEVEAVKHSGIAAELGADWVDVMPDFASAPDAITAVNRALAQVITAHADKTPLIFASDCMAALGAMKGLEAQQPAVIWYDAHGDFNTPETTPSGFLGGMPLAMLVGRGDLRYMQGLELAPIAESDVIITDARDLDPEEAIALRSSGVTHLPQVDALLTHPLPQKPLYIHFDTDVVDTSEMPGMSYPAPGGPSMVQAAATLSHLRRSATVAGILFSLWNDSLTRPAGDQRALENTLRLVRA